MNIDVEIISKFLNLQFKGCNICIKKNSTINNPLEESILFVKKYDDYLINSLNNIINILAIVPREYDNKLKCSYIISDNPRLSFIKVLSEFFCDSERYIGTHKTAVIEDGAIIGEGTSIGANCYIGENVIIGNRCYIYPNVVISGKCIIGNDVVIKSGAVIGQSGFGYEKDENGEPIKFPHLGNIIIEDNVHIGANTAIDRATLETTYIRKNSKIDNLVHIAHNDVIGENSFIIAGAILGGGVYIGDNCWVAPNVTIKEQTRVMDNSLLGLATVVLKDIPENSTIVGNPGRQLMENGK